MALNFNGNDPYSVKYNDNNLSSIIYNGTTVWQKPAVGKVTDLKINGSSSSSTSSTCTLSWSAPTVTNATLYGFSVLLKLDSDNYYFEIGTVLAAGSTSFSYTYSNPSICDEGATFMIESLATHTPTDTSLSSYSNLVSYTYVSPASIDSAPTLSMNGSTSSTCYDDYIYLSWTAASTTGVSDLVYWVMCDSVTIATTENTYYSVSSASSRSGSVFKVYAYSATASQALASNSITFYYEDPSVTLTAYASRTKTSSSTDTSSTPITARPSGNGYGAISFPSSSKFDDFSSAWLYFYVESAASTVTMKLASTSDSWLSYNAGWANKFTTSTSNGSWASVNITSYLNTLISDVGSIASSGLRVYFRSENYTKICGYTGSNPAYVVLS